MEPPLGLGPAKGLHGHTQHPALLAGGADGAIHETPIPPVAPIQEILIAPVHQLAISKSKRGGPAGQVGTGIGDVPKVDGVLHLFSVQLKAHSSNLCRMHGSLTYYTTDWELPCPGIKNAAMENHGGAT